MPRNTSKPKTIDIADVGAMAMASYKKKKLAQSKTPKKKKPFTGILSRDRKTNKLKKNGNITKTGRVRKQRTQAIRNAYKTSLAMKKK